MPAANQVSTQPKFILQVLTSVRIEFHPYLVKAIGPLVKFAQSESIRIASFGGLTPVVRKTPFSPLSGSASQKTLVHL
jgi:hypothetical protein